MSVTIYGASDDLIEVEGDLREEFVHYSNDAEPAYLAFSDGTLLSVVYGGGKEAFWRIAPIRYGAAKYTLHQATDEDKDYSDRVTLDGDIQWVVCGRGYAVRGD